MSYSRRKWKPNKAQKEAFKLKLIEQDNALQELQNAYSNKIDLAYWNDNKSSLYIYLNNGERYRISTHHLPNRDWETREFNEYRNCSFVDKEIVTNSRDNIINKAREILERGE